MSWELIVDRGVSKRLKKFPRKDVERIIAAVRELAVNPYSGDIEKMAGEEDAWKRRVGSYRIFYEVHAAKRIVYVSHVKRRTSTTY